MVFLRVFLSKIESNFRFNALLNETRQNSVQMFGRLAPVKHETDNFFTQKQ